MKRLKDSTLLPEQVLGWSYNQFISSITELSLDPAISHQVVYSETQQIYAICTTKLNKASGYAMVVHGRPQTPKNTSFWGSPSPHGSYSPYILGDTTRPGHVTCALV